MQMLTISQVAEKLQITERAVKAIIKRGQLPTYDASVAHSGRSLRNRRIAYDDLMAFLESRRVVPPPLHAPRRRRRHFGVVQ